MTGVALAINADAGSPAYAARAFRNALAAVSGWDGIPLAGRQGVRPMGGTAANVVTLAGTTITVNLHVAEVTPGWSAVTGSYMVALTAIENHTLTPADATNPRKDIVIGRVYDHDESASSLRQYITEYIAGTAGPSPSEPSVPQGGIKLATIDVPASGGGSAVVTNSYTQTAAAGGILPVRTVTERDALVTPYTGQAVYRMDKGWPEYYDGTGWRTHRTVVSPGNLADITHPSTSQAVFHTGTRAFWVWSGSAWVRLRPLDHTQPTQTGSGSLSAGGNGVAICSVVVADPGYSYYIKASGSLDWAGLGGNANELMRAIITLDSTVYNTNVLSTAFALTPDPALGSGSTYPTIAVPERISSAFGAFTGAKTVRLIARKDGVSSVTLPAASTATSLSVEAVPAT